MSAPAPIAIIAGKPTTALDHGYLPAAQRLGRFVCLLTDRPDEHMAACAMDGVDIVACEVSAPMAVIDRLEQSGHRPGLVFSDSDHLQTSTALVAQWFALSGKDWRVAHAARNKAIMRRRLADAAVERAATLRQLAA